MNILEYLPRRSRGKYSPIFFESEANNCFSVIFSGEYQESAKQRAKKARKVLDLLSSCASKMLYSPVSAVNITLSSYIHR